MKHQLITKKNIIACAMTCAMVTGMCAMPGCANKNSTEIDNSNTTENANTNNNANNSNNANRNFNTNGGTTQTSFDSGSQGNGQSGNDQQSGSSGARSSDGGSQASSGGSQASSGGSSSGSTQQTSGGGESSAQPASGGSSEATQRWVEDYTTVWVEDSAAYSEQVPIYDEIEQSVCNICGAEITYNEDAHIKAHVLAGQGGSWHGEYAQVLVGYDTITYPATGHYETVVSGGHWE